MRKREKATKENTYEERQRRKSKGEIHRGGLEKEEEKRRM